MELVDGKPLAGPVSAAEAIRYAIQIPERRSPSVVN
jgi:hypothetical protein